jgi:hypothetical protein
MHLHRLHTPAGRRCVWMMGRLSEDDHHYHYHMVIIIIRYGNDNDDNDDNDDHCLKDAPSSTWSS